MYLQIDFVITFFPSLRKKKLQEHFLNIKTGVQKRKLKGCDRSRSTRANYTKTISFENQIIHCILSFARMHYKRLFRRIEGFHKL